MIQCEPLKKVTKVPYDMGLGLYEAGAEPLGRIIIIQDIISLQEKKWVALQHFPQAAWTWSGYVISCNGSPRRLLFYHSCLRESCPTKNES
jgi:hypothetical protein